MALVADNLYVMFFNFNSGLAIWVMLGDMFPNEIRGSVLAVCGLAQRAANYLVVQSFPSMAENWGWRRPNRSTLSVVRTFGATRGVD